MNKLFQKVSSLRRKFSTRLANIPTLKEFLATQKSQIDISPTETIHETSRYKLTFYIETYGCQMNVSDSEIVKSILMSHGHILIDNIDTADLILTNTCAIRENAENKVIQRLQDFKGIRIKNKKIRKHGYPLVGVLGCMAERLKTKLLEKQSVDFVCGPDAYRDIPRLIDDVISTDQKTANIRLSLEETYADIPPVREINSSSAFVSIMRGCNNMCSFCVVPFTRGRERSREYTSILREVDILSSQGCKEIVLLGQNVNGYHDISMHTKVNTNETIPNNNTDIHKSSSTSTTTTTTITSNNDNNNNNNSMQYTPSPSSISYDGYQTTPGFTNLFNSRMKNLSGVRFADLLKDIASINPEIRIRFTSPHPKDFPHDVLNIIASTPNICNSIHMPVQSGCSTVLERMRRGYTREAFIQLIQDTRTIIPNVCLSTDVIAGFCGETESEHADTVSLMRRIRFDQAFMFAYSLREKTHAAHTMTDDVPEDIKLKRLQEIIATFREQMLLKNYEEDHHRIRLVLVENYGKKSSEKDFRPFLTGRTDGNKRVLFPAVKRLATPVFSKELLYNFFYKDNVISDKYILKTDNIDNRVSGHNSNLNSDTSSPEHVDTGDYRMTLKQDLIPLPVFPEDSYVHLDEVRGRYVAVYIHDARGQTLIGEVIGYTTLVDYNNITAQL